ncbi:MAG: polyprenyl synthetase family protein [Clostridiales Family XIII bacterium]|nr:polyprenyl synthetase family protein [Clostridiales Family XIII bacterium]
MKDGLDVFENIETRFAEGFALCAEQGVKLPSAELRYSVLQTAHDDYGGYGHADDFAAAHLAYYLFRDLHSRTDEAPEAMTLLGDYFFSLFSKFLIPVDSVPLIDAFSERLTAQTTEVADGCEAETARMISAGGKRLRPSLAYLCYKMGSGSIGHIIGSGNRKSSVKSDTDRKPIMPLMTMLELMHTASLIHDDVVDDAHIRRGTGTINAAKGKAFAVNAGDFLLAKAMTQLHHYRGTGINEALAGVSAEMCLGEFQQRRTAFDLDAQSEYLYLLQIRRKTASLLAASCYCGALAGGLSEEHAEALRCFGERFGTAFQMLDDLKDYSDDAGKDAGQDIRSGIFTLPVLLLKDRLPDEIRKLLETRDKDEADICRIMDYVRSTDALLTAREQISRLSGEAMEALTLFPCPDRSEKSALIQLADSIIHFSK